MAKVVMMDIENTTTNDYGDTVDQFVPPSSLADLYATFAEPPFVAQVGKGPAPL